MFALTGAQSILDAAIGSYYFHQGFRLASIGDYTLMLSYRGAPLGVFSHDIVTISVIRAACQEHLEAIGAS